MGAFYISPPSPSLFSFPPQFLYFFPTISSLFFFPFPFPFLFPSCVTRNEAWILHYLCNYLNLYYVFRPPLQSQELKLDFFLILTWFWAAFQLWHQSYDIYPSLLTSWKNDHKSCILLPERASNGTIQSAISRLTSNYFGSWNSRGVENEELQEARSGNGWKMCMGAWGKLKEEEEELKSPEAAVA